MKKIKLKLKGMRFFGHYGYYPEERKLLTELILDVSVTFNVPEKDALNLEDSLNYETIYKLVHAEMNQSEALIENIAKRVLHSVKSFDSRIEKCNLSLYKRVQLGGSIQNILLKIED